MTIFNSFFIHVFVHKDTTRSEQNILEPQAYRIIKILVYFQGYSNNIDVNLWHLFEKHFLELALVLIYASSYRITKILVTSSMTSRSPKNIYLSISIPNGIQCEEMVIPQQMTRHDMMTKELGHLLTSYIRIMH